MPTQFRIMSRLQRLGDFTDTMSIPIDPISLVAIGVLVWALFGLWLWLDFQDNDGGSGPFVRFMFTFLCGPSAWIVATWKATHQPPRPRQRAPMRAENWMWPHNWRN
jgi:hypothetical protein